MFAPGASRSTAGDMLEKEARLSSLTVAPTATAVEMHAGELIWVVESSLPEAMAANTPAARRLSIAGFCGALSQVPENRPPPKLMLTDATTVPPPRLMLANTWSRAWI
jgi:hypothetical protein